MRSDKPVLVDVAPRDRERVGAKYPTASISALGKTRAARTASEPPPVQRSSDARHRFGIAGQCVVFGEGRHQEFADEATRHDDALVDIERHALDVGAVEKIGRGLSRGHARFDQRVEAFALAPQELGVEKRIERVDRKVQAFEDEIGGFVERGRRAVAESEARGAEAADGVAQPVARRRKQLNALVRTQSQIRGSGFILEGGPETGTTGAHAPCLHSCMKCLRGLPCRFWASAFCEHSIDLAERAPASSAPGVICGFVELVAPVVSSGAAASKATAPPEMKQQSAAAQPKVRIRMFEVFPVVVDRQPKPGAAYKGRALNIKPSKSLDNDQAREGLCRI